MIYTYADRCGMVSPQLLDTPPENSEDACVFTHPLSTSLLNSAGGHSGVQQSLPAPSGGAENTIIY